MTNTAPPAHERVAKGVAYLDKVDPEWYLKIDLAQFDLRSGCDCILGQLYQDKAELDMAWSSGYAYALARVLPQQLYQSRYLASCQMGFTTYPFSQIAALYPSADHDETLAVGADVAALEAEWTRVIKEKCNA